ncbi:cell division protein ZipA [Corallincola platygyrae]|uniref:Cell division protein ZipA n=1 Tax=Corallincola platygyrae TaxID=1193278 RepID=A0ABW4XSC2_9GAMM
MDGFRIVLIIVGAIAIGAILIHGLWSIRKQSSQNRIKSGDFPVGQDGTSLDNEGFDQDGIGKVRVVGSAQSDDDYDLDDQPLAVEQQPSARVEPAFSAPSAAPAKPKEKVEPSFSASHIDDEPTAPMMEQVDLFAEPELDESKLEQPIAAETAATKQVEAKPADVQTDKPQPKAEPAPVAEEPQDVMVLNVVAGPSGELRGAIMLPCLLTLGFKFGEMSIFHRHETPAGTGPVLFSLVNMVKPGTFDPDGMESFSTQGVSLFMTLPCYGEAQKNFSLMLKAAEQLASELGGQVLDDQRNVLTKQKIQHYQERIREFERKKLLTI